MWRRWLVLAGLLGGLVVSTGCSGGDDDDVAAPPPEAASLSIAPTLQQTPVWCWAASAEMVFRYYGLPNVNPAGNYQCGLIASYFGGACGLDCSLCVAPIGPMSNMHQLLTGYGDFVTRTYGIASRVLSGQLLFRVLAFDELSAEIAAGRPVVVGIAPGGGFALPNASSHIAVVVGYDARAGAAQVVVNDPFPFQYPPYSAYPNPYVAAGGYSPRVGQYVVPYAALVERLGWANSIVGLR